MVAALNRPIVTYAGTSLQVLSGSERRITFWLVGGLDDPADVRGEDTVVPALAGRIARNRVRDRRVIEIQGYVRGLGSDDAARADDFRDIQEVLRALFAPTNA
jgi:hypothetical protein